MPEIMMTAKEYYSLFKECEWNDEADKPLPYELATLHYDGGDFILYVFPNSTEKEIAAARRHIYNEHDVVSLKTERLSKPMFQQIYDLWRAEKGKPSKRLFD